MSTTPRARPAIASRRSRYAQWRAKRTPMVWFWLGVLAFVLAVWFFGQFASTPYRRPVAPSSVGSAPITGSPCYSDGGIARAYAVDNAGPYTLVQVTCADGIRYQVAR